MTHAEKTIWKDYQFEVELKKAGEDNWQGWTEYKGIGRFSIYAGEGTLLVREEEEKIKSVLYQKCYRETGVDEHEENDNEGTFGRFFSGIGGKSAD